MYDQPCSSVQTYARNQRSVMTQVEPSRLSMLDSMNSDFHRSGRIAEVMEMADLVIINDGEVRMLAEDENVVTAMQALSKQNNTATLVVKRGEQVFSPSTKENLLLCQPSCTSLVDPTGCGDTFAGALAATLASGRGR